MEQIKDPNVDKNIIYKKNKLKNLVQVFVDFFPSSAVKIMIKWHNFCSWAPIEKK